LIALTFGVKILVVFSFFSSKNTCDRRTDGQKDRQTEIITIPKTALA